MDIQAAIERHREALKRVVAALAVMAGWGQSGSRESGSGRSGQEAADCPLPTAYCPLPAPGCRPTLPRSVHRAVLRLLRPVESAARRLVIALALAWPPVPLPPPRPRPSKARKSASIFVRPRVGTGIVLPPGAAVPARLAHLARPQASAAAAPARIALPLLDPLPRRRRRRWSRSPGVPRIGMAAARGAVPAAPMPGDPLDARRLALRLAALARALDDLPGQAVRFARWQARRDRALAAGRIHRVAPLRGGRPPGGRLAHYDPDAARRRKVRDVDEILAHAHALAHHALEHPRLDTS
jgi:hypothetical protein